MKIEKKEKLKIRIKKVSAILKLAILLFILVGIPVYIYFFNHDLITKMSSLENIKELFSQYKTQSIFIYIIIQILQIIICVIPGQWLQIAAGMMYGFWVGYLFSFIGAAIGTIVTYYLAKLLGRDALHLIFGETKINDFVVKLNSKKAIIIVFLIFLIPGVPKDLCSYAAGISEIKLKPFIIVSLIGRTPGMMGSIMVGKQLGIGSWTGAIIVAIVFIILFGLGVIYRKSLMNWFDKMYEKMMK